MFKISTKDVSNDSKTVEQTKISSQVFPKSIEKALSIIGDGEMQRVIPVDETSGKQVRSDFLHGMFIYYGEALTIGSCFKPPVQPVSVNKQVGGKSEVLTKTFDCKIKPDTPDFEVGFIHIFETDHKSIKAYINVISDNNPGKFNFSRLSRTSASTEISNWESKGGLTDGEASELLEHVINARYLGMSAKDIFEVADKVLAGEYLSQNQLLSM